MKLLAMADEIGQLRAGGACMPLTVVAPEYRLCAAGPSMYGESLMLMECFARHQ
jgi:hypothetical protein